MAFRLQRNESLRSGARRVAREALDDALRRLEAGSSSTAPGAQVVHEVRKRSKEVRGALRLVRPGLGPTYRDSDRELRRAANALSGLRDAAVMAKTLDRLTDGASGADRAELVELRSSIGGPMPNRVLGPGRDEVERAIAHLRVARARIDEWPIPEGFDDVGAGLRRTYREGRRGLRRARRLGGDDDLHEWRKAVKHLWYQLRLLEPMEPQLLAPMVDGFDGLAELLGDDHDLAVLVAGLEGADDAPSRARQVAVGLARRRQRELRDRAFRAGIRLYAETPDAFAARMAIYWDLAHSGGIDAPDAHHDDATDGRARAGTVERERKFLLDADTPDLGQGRRLRQGYVAVEDDVSVRVRATEGGEPEITIKAGKGATRTEVEWTVSAEQFEALWPLTEGRRIDKARHEVRLGSRIATVDVFDGALAGLRVVEVEFGDDADLAAFTPPGWFGREVTDDERYTNAALSSAGAPPP